MNIYLITIVTFYISIWNPASSINVEHKNVTNFNGKQVLKHKPLETDHFEQNETLRIFGRIQEDTFDDHRTIRRFCLINIILTSGGIEGLKKLENLESLCLIRSKGNIHISENFFTTTNHLKELVVHLNNRVIIESNALRNLKNLELLSVDNQTFNAFSNETFEHCRKMKYLSWTNGFVGKIDSNTFRSLKLLETLILRDLQLEHIEPSTFKDLPLLKILNLDQNRIKYLSGKEFQLLPSLQDLSLEKNALISIDYAAILANSNQLRILNLSQNKFPCDTILKLKNQVIKLDDRERLRCEHHDLEIQIMSA